MFFARTKNKMKYRNNIETLSYISSFLRKKYMRFIAIVGQLPTIFQVVKTIKAGNSSNISVEGLALALFCTINWLIYGVRLRDYPIILWSTLGVILTIINIIVTIFYQ
jgi:uncharacterized protein with PQ loop repeat